MNTSSTPTLKRIFFATSVAVITTASAHAAVIITAARETSSLSTTGYFNFSSPENTYASSGNYSSNPVPTNSNVDLANGIVPNILSGSLHPVSGPLSMLTNGLAQINDDEPSASTFSDDAITFRIDLGSDQAVAQFNSYSWHTTNRALQMYTLYAASSNIADPTNLSLYTTLGSVDTFAWFGNLNSGQQGVSFYSDTGSLGTYRYFAISQPASIGTFFGEIDIVAVPEPATLTTVISALTFVVLRRRRRLV